MKLMVIRYYNGVCYELYLTRWVMKHCAYVDRYASLEFRLIYPTISQRLRQLTVNPL